jgi:hypothetical protein
MNSAINSSPPVSRRIAYYLVLISIAIVFAGSALLKFMAPEEIVSNFSKWGLLEYKNYIAAAELFAVILYVIPKTNTWGLLLLTAIMGGAIYTHASHQEPFFFNAALVLTGWINHLFIRYKK